jgi:hypothetical protein
VLCWHTARIGPALEWQALSSAICGRKDLLTTHSSPTARCGHPYFDIN